MEARLNQNLLSLYALILACCAIELTLGLSDLGVIEPAYLRRQVYYYAAFWPGLLDDWIPNYAAQPIVMFLTYGFLHGGTLHLLVNMITLWFLGRAVVDRAGQSGLIILYVIASLGGALFFALLTDGPRPMVGASGALFGLLGALLVWEFMEREDEAAERWHIGKLILLLVILNIGLHWLMSGQLAWQAHLGGAAAGAIAALLFNKRMGRVAG